VTYTRNDLWRIKRAAKHLDKTLDTLSRANGELRPKQFADLRKHLDHATNVTENVIELMEKALESRDLDSAAAH
jgi:vacuolar-type H+-ATPase subunit D/Vma8